VLIEGTFYNNVELDMNKYLVMFAVGLVAAVAARKLPIIKDI